MAVAAEWPGQAAAPASKEAAGGGQPTASGQAAEAARAATAALLAPKRKKKGMGRVGTLSAFTVGASRASRSETARPPAAACSL